MRNAPSPDHTSGPDDAGFTLGETMIAAFITVIVVGAAIAALTGSIALTGTARAISETNHGLQAAMSLMVRDVMQTGQGIPIGGVPLPNGAGAVAVVRPAPSAMTFGTADLLPALVPGNNAGPTVLAAPTDLLTVTYVDQTLPISQNPLTAIAPDGSSITVNAATPVTGVNGLRAGDLVLFTNSLGTALQMVTTTPTSQVVQFASGDPMSINQPAAPLGNLVQLQSTPGVYPPTTATRVMMVSYYVDTVTDPAMPRLSRRVNLGQTMAIAMGIENFQVTYDLVNGTTNPVNVVTPGVGDSPNQIRKVNITLAARSQEDDPQTRQPYRNQMSTEVGLRSLSFVDRYN